MSRTRPPRLARGLLFLSPVLLAIAVVPSAHAGRCGDDVEGVRVACRCGDVVVSDTRLLAGDPVVNERCEGDGLILRAPAGAPPLRLDLGGQTIVGQGRGTGLRVLDGGEGGAVIVGGAEGKSGAVSAFGTGLRAVALDAVSELRRVRFSGHARDGVVLRSLAAEVSDVVVEQNGRDGARIGGRSPTARSVDARHNGRFGVNVTARGAQIDARAEGNRRAEFRGRADAAKAGSR